ncbi:hypothetical protein CSUI_001887 [Cystoisospora suis]|uniref:Uncharacterized protein n=1 Tax=Cystoisospora suis TaxID=483139 RepID=A0A2C6KJN1_9APIC|nr:hypothetical protein CSUI_001887 [Cystoisospora suis]
MCKLFHILMDEEEWSLSPETDEETHAGRSPSTTSAGSTPSPELSSFREAAPEKTSVLRPASSLEGSVMGSAGSEDSDVPHDSCDGNEVR